MLIHDYLRLSSPKRQTGSMHDSSNTALRAKLHYTHELHNLLYNIANESVREVRGWQSIVSKVLYKKSFSATWCDLVVSPLQLYGLVVQQVY
jgi:hypothetical protein